MNEKIYEKMLKIRKAEDLTIAPCARLRDEIDVGKGKMVPLKLRSYQTQMIFHALLMKRFVIGDDTGLGKCSGFNTLIQTDKGLIKIGEMHDWSEMEPETFEPIDRDWNVLVDGDALPVKNFYYGGTKPTIKTKTRYGFEVEGSRVHPLLVWRDGEHQWIETRNIKEGDYLCVERREMPFPKEEPSLDVDVTTKGNSQELHIPSKMSPSFARFLGYYIGEGSLTARGQLRISQCPQKNLEIRADIISLIDETFETSPKNLDSTDLYVNKTYIRYQNGLDHVTSHDREVPDCILRSTRESNRQFLRGIFEAEGHVANTGGIEFSTASEELGRQLQIMLLRFGIVSNRSPKTVKRYEHNDYWRLTIFGDDARTFRDKIGFVSKRKKNALESVLSDVSNPNHDIIPNVKPLIENLRSLLKTALKKTGSNENRKGSGFKQYGVSFVTGLGGIRNSGRNPSYDFIEKFLAIAKENGLEGTMAYQDLANICTTRYFYDPVVNLEEGKAEVFDIEVDDPRHCFVANGLMNHNTLEAIATQCYLWEKEPDLIPIVVTNTSAMRQWGSEIEKFCEDEVGYQLVEGGPEDRVKILEDFVENWDEDNPEFLVTNYHRLRRDKRTIQALLEGTRYVLLYDECFDYYTPVTLEDGTTEIIGKIVNQRMDVKVLSYNWETCKVEPKRILNWYKNEKKGKDQDTLLKIKFGHGNSGYGNSVRCTRSHEFYTPEGEKIPAYKLEEGSEVVRVHKNTPSQSQIQIIMGSLLGDASISHPTRDQPGVCFVQGQDQKDYLNWKRESLASINTSEILELESGYKKGSKVYQFRTYCNADISHRIASANMYQDKKKRVTREWLNQIGPLGLAVWYGDDGTIQSYDLKDGSTKHTITLHTEGFSYEENELLREWLKETWDLECSVLTSRKSDGREYPFLSLTTESSRKFLELLPGKLPGVEYKFPEFQNEVEITQGNEKFTTAIDRVVSVEECEPKHLTNKYVYDIEVEDNHNYFAGGTLVSNCTAFKSTTSQTHKVCKQLAEKAERVYGLTATLIKNNLEEGYGIFRVIHPEIFRSKKGFHRDYCITRKQRIPGMRKRYVRVVVGHSVNQIDKFKEKIDPYYLGRAKHHVADELPPLTAKELYVPMLPEQWDLYQEALSGLLTVNLGTEEEEDKETTKLTQLMYCQEIVNSPYLIGRENRSSKEEYFLELLKEDFADEKVIVFTRFRSMVDRFQELLEEEGYSLGIKEDEDGNWVPNTDEEVKGMVRITGEEDSEMRDAGKIAFTESENTNLIFLTMAGAEAINLQQAKVMVFFDLPWSAGDYLQLVGRMIRIGSPHDRVYAIHLISEGPREEETIDHHVLKTLQKKMGWIERALGERLVKENADELDEEDQIINIESDTEDIFRRVQDSARSLVG